MLPRHEFSAHAHRSRATACLAWQPAGTLASRGGAGGASLMARGRSAGPQAQLVRGGIGDGDGAASTCV